jgi:hypothetical protein
MPFCCAEKSKENRLMKPILLVIVYGNAIWGMKKSGKY